jgi:hypothetical protein
MHFLRAWEESTLLPTAVERTHTVTKPSVPNEIAFEFIQFGASLLYIYEKIFLTFKHYSKEDEICGNVARMKL